MNALRTIISKLGIILLGVLPGALIGEIILRAWGYPRGVDQLDYTPGALLSDPELGWVHKPGSYILRDTSLPPEDPRLIRVTYWPRGLRATRPDPTPPGKEVLLLGCSFVEGYELSDEETFAWKLQERLPEVAVQNLGSGGYGTLQARLAMQRYLKDSAPNVPSLIVYGFADFHSLRNIKNPVSQVYRERPGIFPFCDLEGCSTWGGRSKTGSRKLLRLLALLDESLDSHAVSKRIEEARTITIRLLAGMAEDARNAGAQLLLAPVSLQDDSWNEVFRQLSIPTIACDTPTLHAKEYRLPDGHPNAKWSDEFASCLSAKLIEDFGPTLRLSSGI